MTRDPAIYKGFFEWTKGNSGLIFDRMSLNRIVVTRGFETTPIPSTLSPTAQVAFDHVSSKIAASEVNGDPFAHVVIDDIFPREYYHEIRRHFPPEPFLTPLSETGRTRGTYKERKVLLFNDEHFTKLDKTRKAFWVECAAWLYSEHFIRAAVSKFLPFCEDRLAALFGASGEVLVRSDALLVSDRSGFAIGPHSDAPHRLISFLFYLPEDDRDRDLGTSLYRSKDPNFECRGGPHYDFGDFIRTGTVAFLPNRLMMFVKSGRSFHGVEPVTHEGVDRRLLINNVRLLKF